MSQFLWTAAPTMYEVFYSEKGVFNKVEDISESKVTTGGNGKVWLEFTLLWTWPGPVTRLQGGPKEIQPRLGIRGIPYGEIKIDIEKAYSIAEQQLKSTNCGDKFIDKIDLYWPLTPECKEPFYNFTTNLHNVIHVGAYSGNLSGCGS